MKKNLFLRLCLILMVTLSLYSCIHDEIISSSDSASTEYVNKSLWKQDEKYIKNVMKVYAENEAEIKKVNGIPYWNFATTVDSFDESYVAIPVVNNEKVVSVLKVPRHGKNIYFYYTNEEGDLNFFQGLVFAKTKKAGTPDGSMAQTDGMACTRQWISMWFPDNEQFPTPETGSGHWESVSVVKCKSIKDECVGVVNEFGICEGDTGDDGGYPYPGGGGGEAPQEEEETPCEKLTKIGKSSDTKSYMNTLKGKTNDTKEHGYVLAEAGGTVYDYPVQGEDGKAGITFTLGVGDKIDGYIHSHYTGLLSIFSPDDMFSIAIFLKNNAIKNLDTFVIGVVTASGTQYMMVIDDSTKFQTFANGLFTGNSFYQDALDNYSLMYNDFFKITPSNSAAENERSFLNYIETSGSGLKVLKGSSDMQNWQSLQLDQNNNVVPTNCN
ncbi:hypothetical protein [Chryseobacterium sp. GP-SGM7]|uniref:hypothetical protein n=1 Tax=Chryseobacterium sp. GP-SGM7 TaxID=3411323 RepID=UPI003B963C51